MFYLLINIQGQSFFDEPEMTLVELAVSINKWLKSSQKNQDFIYETMDYDEEPIIIFKHIEDGLYQVESIWQQKRVEKLIKKEEIVAVF